MNHRAFTLIELLVVIAIIGVLAAVVLAAMSGARNKSADATVESDMSSIKQQMELYYSNNGTYGTAALDCTAGGYSDGVITKAIANANAASLGTVLCDANGTGYVFESPLKNTPGTYWCVDSSGGARTTTTAITSSSTVCP